MHLSTPPFEKGRQHLCKKKKLSFVLSSLYITFAPIIKPFL